MSTLNTETLNKIRKSDDPHIAPFRADGKTYGTPTWIWSVVVDNQLYVRAYNGTRLAPSFADAVQLHEVIDSIEQSALCSG